MKLVFILNYYIMKYLLFSLVIIFVFNACQKEDTNPIGPRVVPNSFVFRLLKGGANLPDNILNNIELIYYDSKNNSNNIKIDKIVDTLANLGILNAGWDIAYQSGDYGIKSFYLKYPNSNKLDTLYVDYKRYTDYNSAANDSCFCHYPLKKILFNGKTVALDSSLLKVGNVYIFNTN